MFATRSEEIDRLAGASAVAACWAQWVALGSPASASRDRAAASIVDPEALVVMSLQLHERERRLGDLVAWWARVGSRLTSVQRFQTVAERFPADGAHRALGLFASHAAEAGDRRWARHVDPSTALPPTREKGPDEPSLLESSTLWLRLRAGFGVGAKADTLAFLLGTRGAWASTRLISFATGYSSVTTRGAAREMALARFVLETGERPVEYSARPDAWAPLLALPDARDAPPWRFWSEVFAFLAGAMAWSESARSSDAPGQHVLASRARDLMEKHRRAFELARIPVPQPDSHRGLEAVDGLLETTRAVAEWVEESV